MPKKDRDKEAEVVVGFYNTFQLSGESKFSDAALKVWEYIKKYMIDKTYRDWFKQVDQQGKPVLNEEKIGPWNWSYHHGRMCFEMVERLS